MKKIVFILSAVALFRMVGYDILYFIGTALILILLLAALLLLLLNKANNEDGEIQRIILINLCVIEIVNIVLGTVHILVKSKPILRIFGVALVTTTPPVFHITMIMLMDVQNRMCSK